jgi:P-type Cu2+ transporter
MSNSDVLAYTRDWSLGDEHKEDSSFEGLSAFVQKSGKSQHLELHVSGAKCAGCLGKIEKAVGALDGVSEARLNLSTGKFNITWQGALPASRIAETVSSLGYGVSAAAETDADELQRKEERELLLAMGVAAFAAANIMLLSVSVWAGAGEMGANTKQILHAISGVIALPAIVYSGRPFFRSAWSVLKRGRANMDVPISLAITLAFTVSVVETIRGGEHAYFDAAAMLIFFLLIGRFLEARVRRRACSAANDLAGMSSRAVTRIDCDGNALKVNPGVVAPGDTLLLAQGERAVVDMALADELCELDESLVTGESAPHVLTKGMRIYAGAVNLSGPVQAKALSRASDSLLADIGRMLDAGEQRRSAYRKIADKAVALYVPFVHSAAALTFIGWMLAGAGFRQSILIAVSTLIITCPCALALAAPVAHVVAAGKLFQKGIFLKSGDALERFASVDRIVLDKTGTLSLGVPHLSDATDQKTIADAALLARASRHPLSRAITDAAGAGPVAPSVKEIPGCGLEANIDGILWRLGSGRWIGTDLGETHTRNLYLQRGDEAPVALEFTDRLIPGTGDAIRELEKAGYETEILSGDAEGRVAEVAHDLGISRYTSAASPRDKAAHLEALREQGHKVLMVGDGLNDAGALSLAHASVTPGTAIDISQSASDAVYTGGISSLPLLLKLSRRTRNVMLQNFTFAALYNLVAIPIAVTGHATPLVAALAMSFSSVAVSLNAIRLAAFAEGK